MMKHLYLLYIFQLNIYSVVSSGRSVQQGYFSIIRNSTYIPKWSYSFLCNLSANLITDEMTCGKECVKYRTCGVAVYYPQSKTCSLFDEDGSLGQISAIGNEESFVLTMSDRQPESYSITLQSTWIANSTIIIGNPSGQSGSSLTELDQPTAAIYDKFNERIIVADNYNRRVLKFNANNLAGDGKIIAGGNGFGCNLNQFQNIPGIAFDSSNQLYTSDSGCSRILKFPSNSDGSAYGELIASLSLPQGICIDQSTDDLYVAVYGWAAVVKIDKNRGQSVVAGGNGWGTGLNQFNGVNGVYFDRLYTKKLYVIDSGSNRVLAFPSNSTGSTYGVLVAGTGVQGNSSNELNYPRHVVTDKFGSIYVGDADNCRIQRWAVNSTTGETIVGGTCGTNADQLASAEFIFLDEDYNLIVVDRNNNRVAMFGLVN